MTVDRALRLLGFGTDGDRAGGRRRARRDARRRARGGPRDRRAGDADDRHRPGRQREHAARATRCARCAPPARPRAPGSTSTARSASGRRRAAAGAAPIAGAENADSWATDGHKWLQVPYDCGIAFVRDREAHRAAMAFTAAYLVQDADRPARADGLDARVLPPGARAGGLRDPARARPRGRRASSSTACARARTASPTGSRRAGYEVLSHGLNQVLVALGSDDGDRRRARGDPGRRARAGRAGRPGAGGAASGSRSAATSRRSTTSTGRSTRWRPARADDACARPRRAGSSGCRGDRRDLRRDAPARRDEGAGARC